MLPGDRSVIWIDSLNPLLNNEGVPEDYLYTKDVISWESFEGQVLPSYENKFIVAGGQHQTRVYVVTGSGQMWDTESAARFNAMRGSIAEAARRNGWIVIPFERSWRLLKELGHEATHRSGEGEDRHER